MIIVKTPFRISLFGGSTDYESFYREHGSFLIGGTINKHIYLSVRYRPKLLSEESLIVYSKMEYVKNHHEISNPLIREILKFREIDNYIDFYSFSDVKARTGLGGSSSFCVGMLYLLNQLKGISIGKKELIRDGIYVERNLLSESGGIQDQIWPVYGGLNSIEIQPNGDFWVKPLPLSEEFIKELEQHLLLIFTGSQRNIGIIADSHEGKEKSEILSIAKEAYKYLLKEDLEQVGGLLFESWKAKCNISNLISTEHVEGIIEYVMSKGAYGAKLLGAGGCGFVVCMCDPILKKALIKYFDGMTLDFEFEPSGITRIS